MDPLNRNLLATAAPSGPSIDIDEVFSSTNYTGASPNEKRIVNGLDLAGDGGAVWFKNRARALDHEIYDTNMGPTIRTLPNDQNGAWEDLDGLRAFHSDGFTVGPSSIVNQGNYEIISWAFKRSEGFFDCIKYTGDGATTRQMAHNLGEVPGLVLIKEIASGGSKRFNWVVYHKEVGLVRYGALNQIDAFQTQNPTAFAAAPTDTYITLSNLTQVNYSGMEYVAYLFAADNSVVKCGTYTGNGQNNNSIDIGFEPQFIMMKKSDSSGDWHMFDTARGMSTADARRIRANEQTPETTSSGINPTSSGIDFVGASSEYNDQNAKYIYLAIAAP